MDVGSSLTDKDIAGLDKLAVSALDAKPFCFRVAAVFCRAYAFLMCHFSCTSSKIQINVRKNYALIAVISSLV